MASITDLADTSPSSAGFPRHGGISQNTDDPASTSEGVEVSAPHGSHPAQQHLAQPVPQPQFAQQPTFSQQPNVHQESNFSQQPNVPQQSTFSQQPNVAQQQVMTPQPPQNFPQQQGFPPPQTWNAGQQQGFPPRPPPSQR